MRVSKHVVDLQAVKVLVVPEGGLREHIVVERVITEHTAVQATNSWHHQTGRLHKLLAGDDVGLQHSLVDEHESHGLGDDDVDLLRQFDVLDFAQDDGDLVSHVVVLDDPLGVSGHAGGLDGVDLLGSGLDGEHSQNATTGTDIEDNLALKVLFVHENGFVVGSGSHGILEHVLLVSQLAIIVEERVFLFSSGDFVGIHG